MKRSLLALAAALLASPAWSTSVVNNVNGIQVGADGKLERFSGLVIGEELRAVSPGNGEGVVIIGTPELAARYTLAMPAARTAASDTTWRALWSLAKY